MMTDNIEKLGSLFGSYKAEWLRKDIFKYFTEPYYFSSLKGNSPCVLQGGRGTGKTTVLRGLSYQGQYELLGEQIDKFDESPFIGIYFRANTNHVRAFMGKGVSDEQWGLIFEHYFNLVICWEILHFLVWHKEKKQEDEVLSIRSCQMIASSLNINQKFDSFSDFVNILEESMISFQAEINNVADGNLPKLSMAGVPIQTTTDLTIQLKQFSGKIFFLLLDEYENFTDSQQRSMNTLLKHVPDSYTIKIGVREMGWRVKCTRNEFESVNDPADYSLINIDEIFNSNETSNRFTEFARNVCQLRIRELFDDKTTNYDIEKSIAGLSIEEESIKLNIDKNSTYQHVLKFEKQRSIELPIHPLYKYLLGFWAETHGDTLEQTYDDFEIHRKKWDQRYENYKYSLLFKINKGRGGVSIPKYYAGWTTFIKLANGNIRYLMELVYQTYYLHFEAQNDISLPVSPEHQTIAAKNVGWKNLTELEGAWMKGPQLTQLVQSLGTVFGWLAKDGVRSAPEVVQFDISGQISERTRELINMGVMNLALIRMKANKLAENNGIKDYQYSLHPVFAPYFNFSFRRKRKMTISEKDILGCVDMPRETVSDILSRKKVDDLEDSSVPTELTLFDLSE